jgi:putative methyltransferase (TIGR04325 family)
MLLPVKRIIRALTPPLLYEAAHRLRIAGETRGPHAAWCKLDAWSDVDQGWEAYALAGGIGDAAAQRAMDELVVRNGLTALSTSEASHAYAIAFGYAVLRASAGKTDLSILDFGGQLGAYHALARSAAPEARIAYTVQELPAVAAAGRMARPHIRFISDDAALAPRYDLVFTSGALQYVEDWRAKLDALARRADPWLFASRLPILSSADTYVARQNRPDGGQAIGWCWRREDFIAAAQSMDLELVQELRLAEGHAVIAGAAETPKVRGFLFRRGRRAG